MWQRELLDKLGAEQPRWHWRWSTPTSIRGCTLLGRSQKAAVKIRLAYRRGYWHADIYRRMGRGRAQQWVLTTEVSMREITTLADSILGECMSSGGATEMKLNISNGRGKKLPERIAGPGPKFKAFLAKVPGAGSYKFKAPAVRKKVLSALWKKYKSMGDGMTLPGKKHKIMDAADGYATYVLEDMSDGELLSFAKWKGLVR